MCPRSATLYVDTHALPTHLFDNAKVRLRSAINILAMTRLLDEKEEPGGTLAYINGALLSLLSDALSKSGGPQACSAAPWRDAPGLAGALRHRPSKDLSRPNGTVDRRPGPRETAANCPKLPTLFRTISYALINQQVTRPRKRGFLAGKTRYFFFLQMVIGFRS